MDIDNLLDISKWIVPQHRDTEICHITAKIGVHNKYYRITKEISNELIQNMAASSIYRLKNHFIEDAKEELKQLIEQDIRHGIT